MKRKIFLLGFFLILIMSLSSCSLFIGEATLDYEYNPARADEIKELMAEADELLASESDYNKYYEAYIEINFFAYEIITYYQKENIKFSMDGNSESPKKMEEFYSIFMEIAEWQTDILVKTYNSSFKEAFFKGWTTAQIDAIFESDFPSEYYDLSEKEEKLMTDFSAFSRDDKLKNAASYLTELATLRNQMATVAGYANYPFFAYDNLYGRDYTTAQSLAFSNYVKTYLVPVAYQLDDKLKIAEASLSQDEYTKIHAQLYANGFEDREIVDKYSKQMGSAYNYEYNYLINRGHCYYSNHENARQGAYTTYMYWDRLPAVYFGPGYQNSFTIVHEFGHYYAASCIDQITSPIDLAETQSQGNEMLFLAYLMNSDEYSDLQKEYIEAHQLLDALSVIIISSIINEFELQVYQTTTPLTQEILDATIIKICEDYGGYEAVKANIGYDPVAYWKFVCVEHACYYISYAMSLIPSLGVYEMAMTDYSNAKNCYLNLCKSKDVNFLQALSTSGFYNPFEENVYIKLSELIA